MLARSIDGLWRLRRFGYRILDHGPGRRILARAATLAAKRETSADVELFFDGDLWMFRVGSRYIPGGRRFVYRHGGDVARWPDYERAVAEDLWFHLYRPKPGDVIIDVGAGIGAETQVFSEAVGPEGRVISVEANPTTFAQLTARIERNRLDNVVPVHAAVVDRARLVYVEDRDDLSERNTVSFAHRASDLPDPVSGLSLDDICDRVGIDRVDFLKMNIEGAEAAAIDGSTRTIERTGAVCIACHCIDAGDTRGLVVPFLRNAGFDVVTRDDERAFVREHVHAIRR
jgi:FkbM family methyltransferase